jgi:hypothetical protein
MKKRHGVFFSFAVLLITAIFTLAGCDNGTTDDDPIIDNGDVPLPSIVKGSTWQDDAGNKLVFGDTIVTATPKGGAAITFHLVYTESNWEGKWYMMFDEDMYTLSVTWDGSELGGEDGPVFFGAGYSFSAHTWTGTNLGVPIEPPVLDEAPELPEVIQNTTWYDEESRRIQFQVTTITTRGPNRTDESHTFNLYLKEWGVNRGKWFLHFDDQRHDITVSVNEDDEVTGIDSEDGSFFFPDEEEPYNFTDHTWSPSAQGGGGRS